MKRASSRRGFAFRSCLLAWAGVAPLAVGLVVACQGGAAQTGKRAEPARTPDYPLALHTRWTYQLRQETGPGVRFNEEDAKLAKGNVLDTTVVSEVTGADVLQGQSYVRVESQKSGRPWLTEWFRLASGALLLGKTFDTETGQEIEMVPPQKILSATLTAGDSWTWRAEGAPVVMRTRVGGPAPVTVPAGSFQGTQVSHEMTIDTGGGLITVQQNRWFVAGVGYVKQETETRAGDRLLSRVALALTAFEEPQSSK